MLAGVANSGNAVIGLRNPALVDRVMAWRPDVVHVTGWAWLSHLQALHAFRRLGVRTLFRGDSHLLDSAQTGLRWSIKRAVLRRVFSWPQPPCWRDAAISAQFSHRRSTFPRESRT